MSLKSTIYEYIRSQYPRVVHKGEILRKSTNEWGYENENAGRRCRDLEHEGLIEKVPHPKGEAQYRWVIGSMPRKLKRIKINPLTMPRAAIINAIEPYKDSKVAEAKNVNSLF